MPIFMTDAVGSPGDRGGEGREDLLFALSMESCCRGCGSAAPVTGVSTLFVQKLARMTAEVVVVLLVVGVVLVVQGIVVLIVAAVLVVLYSFQSQERIAGNSFRTLKRPDLPSLLIKIITWCCRQQISI